MNRTCPHCREKGISLSRLLMWKTYCKKCKAKIGINQIWNFVLFMPLFLVFLFAFLWSIDRFGFVGSYIVVAVYTFAEIAREVFSPLEVRAPPSTEAQ